MSILSTQLSPRLFSDLIHSAGMMEEEMDGDGHGNVEPITAYQCPSCDALYGDRSVAADCCAPDQVSAYQCHGCDTIHHDSHDAEQCCPPSKVAPEKNGRPIFCPVCREGFGSEFTAHDPAASWIDAAACCLSRDLSVMQTNEIAQQVRLYGVDWIAAIEAVTTEQGKKP